eukprot:6557269-Prymnesium_polylepis.2
MLPWSARTLSCSRPRSERSRCRHVIALQKTIVRPGWVLRKRKRSASFSACAAEAAWRACAWRGGVARRRGEAAWRGRVNS